MQGPSSDSVSARALHAVAVTLAEWDELEDGRTSLLGRIGVALECSAGSLWLPADRGSRLECVASWPMPSEPGTSSLAGWERLARTAWAEARPVSFDGDTQQRLAFPLTARDRPVGSMAFADAGPRSPWAELEPILLSVGSAVGVYLESRPGVLDRGPLSARETEVLQRATEGGSSAAIAAQLDLSTSTVKSHFEHIYAKLGVNERSAAVAEGFRRRLLR